MGETCTPAAPCAADLYCTGTCGPTKPAGTLCASSAECSSAAPFCDPYNGGKCDSGVAFAAGAPSCKQFGG